MNSLHMTVTGLIGDQVIRIILVTFYRSHGSKGQANSPDDIISHSPQQYNKQGMLHREKFCVLRKFAKNKIFPHGIHSL